MSKQANYKQRLVKVPSGWRIVPALSRSKYVPHQGASEMARRAARLAV